LLKWQSNALERTFLSSHNPKINAKDNKFISSLGAPFYQQFKKPVRKLQLEDVWDVIKLECPSFDPNWNDSVIVDVASMQ